jgi:cell division protein FtsN
VPAAPPAPATPQSLAPPAATPTVVVRSAAAPPPLPAPRPAAGAATAPSAPRFAVEFGPFVASDDADRVERQLSQAGHQTVRFRQQTGAAVYAVLIEPVPSAREAQALVGTLRQQGFGDAQIVAGDPPSVSVGPPVPLRGAVQIAERLRAEGHAVRIAARAGEATVFVIRHGNFTTSEEAETRALELRRLGLDNQVVRVR